MYFIFHYFLLLEIEALRPKSPPIRDISAAKLGSQGNIMKPKPKKQPPPATSIMPVPPMPPPLPTFRWIPPMDGKMYGLDGNVYGK
jgi:hypothetical protein